MGKKGAKRKTRWRVLPIGTEEGGSGSGNDDDDLGNYSRATQKARPQGRSHSGTNAGGGGGGGGGYYNNKQYYHPRPYGNHEHSQPLVTTEKQIFNEEEYTKITTPRQDVLFKKGYLGRKRPTVAVPEPEPGHVDDSVEDVADVEGNEVFDDQPQYIYTNGFMDQTGVYYINGSGYEMFDPYTGQVAVLVGPHYGHPGGPPPLLAAVSCQPVPLQPLEWFNPPGFLPYVQAPCHGPGMPARDRVKRYSTDSQNCSPVSSESTGPPGSPQESDETGRGGPEPGVPVTPGAPPQLPLVFPHPPPAYVYPGYMFGAPMFNMNGVTVQTTPNQAPSADVTSKRRKKKRKRRRKVNGEGDASEESSSEGGDEKDDAARRGSPSQESSLESDSKLSLSSEEPPYLPAVDGITPLNPRAVDFTCAPKSNGLNVHVDEFEVKPVVVEQVDHSKSNGFRAELITTRIESNCNDERSSLNDQHESKSNDINEKLTVKAVEKEVTYSKTDEVQVKSNANGIQYNINDIYTSTNKEHDSNSNKKDNEVAAIEHAPRPKLDFASAVSPKVNGYATPPAATIEAERADDEAFERYEDFKHLNGFANGTVEEEWITVKPKARKSEATHNGHPEKRDTSNGHAKPFKDHRQTNGRTYKQETRLYKTDVKYNGNGKVDDRYFAKPRANESLFKDIKPAGKGRVNGKMEGNEKDKERKTSSSSSEGKADSPPVKPSRRERKNKSASPPQTPELTLADGDRVAMTTMAVKEDRQLTNAEAQQELGIESTVNAPETVQLTVAPPVIKQTEDEQKVSVTASLPVENATTSKDVTVETVEKSDEKLQRRDIEQVQPIANEELIQSSSTFASESPIEAVLPIDDTTPQTAKEAKAVTVTETPMIVQPIVSQVAPTQSDAPTVAAPVPPPRRKKYRPPSQRLPERAATPGKGSDSDTSSSLESEASVIECLNSVADRSDQSGLSSSDEEVIYAGKLGVEEPRLVGKMKVPRNTWASSRHSPKCEVRVTPPDEASEADRVRALAVEIVDSVIERAVEETTKAKRPNLGITDAVTRWLRSQSPDVLSVSHDEMADIAEETEDEMDEMDDEDGSKNLQRNPLPAPSASGSECRSDGTTGKRVANKIADIEGNGADEGVRGRNSRKNSVGFDSEPRDFHDVELEWDTWDLTADVERKCEPSYDPRSNDTYQVVDNRTVETPDLPLEVCPKLYDANLSVAKYYNLAKSGSPGEGSSDSETEDPKIEVKSDGYRVSLATELARLQQPLPATWKVAPLVVKSEVDDSGVESGDDFAAVKKPSVFKRKLIGRLKGEGGPFPCGGVCCIVQ